MECGGKRSATPLWTVRTVQKKGKAPSPLRSAGALHRAAARHCFGVCERIEKKGKRRRRFALPAHSIGRRAIVVLNSREVH